MSGFQMVRFSDARDRHNIQSENRPRVGIRMLTVIFLTIGAVSNVMVIVK
jgi:hypothetical protein